MSGGDRDREEDWEGRERHREERGRQKVGERDIERGRETEREIDREGERETERVWGGEKERKTD